MCESNLLYSVISQDIHDPCTCMIEWIDMQTGHASAFAKGEITASII